VPAGLVFVPSSCEGPHSWAYGKQLISGIFDPNTSNSGSLVTFINEEMDSVKTFKVKIRLGVVVHACIPSTQEVEEGRSQFGGQPRRHSKILSQ
jgi:hypothetical protein